MNRNIRAIAWGTAALILTCLMAVLIVPHSDRDRNPLKTPAAALAPLAIAAPRTTPTTAAPAEPAPAPIPESTPTAPPLPAITDPVVSVPVQETTPIRPPAPFKAGSQLITASALLGMEVKNEQGESLGRIKELAVHLESGEVGEVLLNSPDIGTPDTWIGITPTALHYDSSAKVVRLDMGREKLKMEPQFESWQWLPFSQSNRMDNVYRYLGGVAFRNTRPGEQVPWGLWHLVDEDLKSSAAVAGMVRDVPSPNWAAYLGYLHRATDLLRASVKNPQSEFIGKIDDLMVNLGAGRVVAVIVSSGEFLGMTDEMSPVPAQALQDPQRTGVLDPRREPGELPDTNPAVRERFVVLAITRDAMEKAPHFSAGQWPDFTDVEYLGSIYRAYGIGPQTHLLSLDLPHRLAAGSSFRSNHRY